MRTFSIFGILGTQSWEEQIDSLQWSQSIWNLDELLNTALYINNSVLTTVNLKSRQVKQSFIINLAGQLSTTNEDFQIKINCI